jgi:hypothetical protein
VDRPTRPPSRGPERSGPDLTGDHLTRVQPDPQAQLNTIAVLDINGEVLGTLLDRQTRQAGTHRVIL